MLPRMAGPGVHSRTPAPTNLSLALPFIVLEEARARKVLWVRRRH